MVFFEAWNDLQVNKRLTQVFQYVDVTRFVVNQRTESIEIYTMSENYLSYIDISSMEFQIKKKFFSQSQFRVRIIDEYTFAKQMTLSKLLEITNESILCELKELSHLAYATYFKAKRTVTENTLVIELEDNFIYKNLANELRAFLVQFMNTHFERDITVDFTYYEKVDKETNEKDTYQEKLIQYRNGIKEDSVINISEEASGNVEPSKVSAAETEPKANEKFKSLKEHKEKFYNKRKLPEDPSVIYGRNFEGKVLSLKEIQEEIGEVVVQGKVLDVEERITKNGLYIFNIPITDFSDSIVVKLFCKEEQYNDVKEKVKKDSFLLIKGVAMYDNYQKEITIGSVTGVKLISDFTTTRMDQSAQKRVELHCHTVMSDMDSVINVKSLINRAKKWGHKALAITDHGVVQSFPEAAHALVKNDEFKIIYGMEAYIVDDEQNIVENNKGQTLDASFVVFDLETTGFGPVHDKIIEIGAVKVVDGKVVDTYSTFVNPMIPIPEKITELTSITNLDVSDAPLIETVLPEFLSFSKDCILVAHNASFDVGFIRKKSEQQGIETDFTVLDTVNMARVLLPHLNNFKLNIIAKDLGVSLESHHRAVDDAMATAEIFIHFLTMLKEKEVVTLEELNRMNQLSPETVKKMPTYHGIILAKNDIGRVNLYKMVSLSHIEYFARRPRIPKSLITANREGLILGTACEAGELYQAILRNKPDTEIERIVNFYDYLEIQPLGNNMFMIEDDRYDVTSIEDLKAHNQRIVDLGTLYQKPVVATCDAHFLDPDDSIYRAVIMKGKGFKDADNQAPLYYRTTEEMLEEFEYLGPVKAKEVVLTNTNLIADMIEKISPVRPDKCPPVIADSDKELRKICYDKAHSMYGPDLPPQVQTRLEHELNSIISNGFAVMYIIAQKLVWKSNEDGYLVGSRGSVGSSFVATMAGITEVNPLAAHYYCPNCHYSDFTSDIVKQYAGSSGCDMPDRECPDCGTMLCKDGHDIPFETFLGFYGDKEPDIDLNFSGEYQAKAHEYTEVIFGKGHTFRAGTIGTLADKTAYGFVKKYYDEHEQTKRNAEINRIVQGCVGVRRTTGQHPGGIIVLPHGEEIYSFTPVQRPANDMNTKTVTTHFDYHSIDHNLLKLDILGHDDPTMIRMLEDLTGLDAKQISLDDTKVLSLFESTKALGIKPKDLMDCDLGCLGIPEFGTDFVMQMLRDTKPKNFSDLVRISGLSHGTDVWLNNAQYYIQRGDCTLSSAICTRDDIMVFLIYKGVENGLSFKIMESVRKGKGLSPDMEEAMRQANVEEWYIESCKKIKYMFPKAHAAAYVMMAFRIAYFKVYYPLAYYASYFSIRASAFNYEKMCLGKNKLEGLMREYKRDYNNLSKKEQDMYKDMRIVQEMYARGFEFLPINIYLAKAHHFQIIDGKLMPSLSSIDGLGDKAAEAIVEAAKDGKFLSQDDFRERTKVSKTVVDQMAEMGIFGDLPVSNQRTILDYLNETKFM